MKITTFVLTIILAFTCSEISAKCHKHRHAKHAVPSIRAGHSKDSGRPKPVTSAEDRKKRPKKDRINDRKRDRYGAFIMPRNKIKSILDDENGSLLACVNKPKIVKQPRPTDLSEPHDGD